MDRLAKLFYFAVVTVTAALPAIAQCDTQTDTKPAQSAPAQSVPAQPAKAVQTNITAAVPTDAKAKQTFADAEQQFKKHEYHFALEGFRKADKQDGGACVACEIQAFKAAQKDRDFKAEREEATLLTSHVKGPEAQAQTHFLAGLACLDEGINNHHDKSFEAADGEFRTALTLHPGYAECVFADANALAHLKQDGAARERFQQYLKLAPSDDVNYARAERFAEHPELARAKIAPNFRLTASDGHVVTLESLTGKVVLIDFWATWCGPCREALPHVQQIAKRFEGQPFQVVSISMDSDDARWREFIAHNNMTWIQSRDGRFTGPLATMFGVNAIPATFTIDADGVLQDQHVGDADIDGKLKKLIARAQDVINKEMANKKTVAENH
jgi:thiol-disulfide isomerase/thioredoxin